jgi:hypothetical protein
MQLVQLIANTYFNLVGIMNTYGVPFSAFEDSVIAGVKFVGDSFIQGLGGL